MDEHMRLTLSPSDFARLSEGAQAELLALLTDTPHPRRGRRRPTSSGPAALTLEQAEAYVADLSDKTLSLLKALASGREEGVAMRDLAASIPGLQSAEDLRTLWSGLKKRTSTITGDPGAYLVERIRTGADGQRGARLHPETRRALRAIFGLEVET